MCRFTFTEHSFRIQKWLCLSLISVVTLITGLNAQSQCDISCKSEINVSIDQNCQGEITPSMVLTSPVYGATLQAFDEDGNLIEDNIVTLEHVGQQVMIVVTEPVCGNTCMGFAYIEDKIAPIISCDDVTIGCADLIIFEDPIPVSCDVAEIVLVSQRIIDISCTSEDYQQQIIRAYQAFDSNGNASEVCEQTLTIEKFDLRLIDFPSNTDTSLYCGSNYPTDEAGNPRFDILGGPTLSGEDLYPDQFIECNTYVDYEDQVLAYNNCVTNVLRTWTISSWFCGVDNVREFNQLYTIIDTVGPEFVCPADMTVSTSGTTCYAVVNLPALEITDECGKDIVRVDINYTGGFLSNSNGGQIHLDAGENTVEYTAYDECGNASSCSFNILVVDQAQPVTLCDQFTTISLSSDGIAFLDAADVDDGSFDECGPVTLELRRVGNNLCNSSDRNFSDYVTFCCADIGREHMVELRVTDASGNRNTCMAFVEVQDKLAPVVLAELPDITVSCTFPFDPDNLSVFGTVATNPDERGEIVLTSDYVEFDGPALDALVIDNCTAVSSDEVTFESINQCGIGFIVRTITASNPQGQSVTFQQRISFKNNEAFDEEDITWPLDYYPTGSCSPGALDPEDLPAIYSRPTFNEDPCDMVGLTYEDQVITNTPNGGGCFKIIRTWYVSDWCQDINGQFPVWTHDQYIEVENSVAPTIDSGCESEMVCVYDADCGPGYIELQVNGSDDCVVAENLIWLYEIDYFSDGSINETGSTNSIAGTYPVGIHTVKWTLADGCGNFDTCTQEFEIRNCKNPTPYCINGLSADLTPMDTDGDGGVDTEMVRLTPDYFDAGSSHICGYEVTLSFSSNVNDTVRIYDCDDIGEQIVEIWVTDLVNGNQDFCRTYILIQDNNGVDFCPEVEMSFDISGRIVTENEDGISEVSVAFEGSEYTAVTNENGEYELAGLPRGAAFNVRPVKDNDPANGVSTLDLILIQKHILGLENLATNYKMIAADINNSGSITAADLIALRKLILGIYDGFPDNSSWRFIDAANPFTIDGNPWANGLAEKYDIPYLNGDMVIDFVGVKVGDVNYTVSMNQSPDAKVRGDNGLRIFALDDFIKKGNSHTITLKVDENIQINGYQMGIKINTEMAEITAINGEPTDASFDFVGTKYLNEGLITAMHYDVLGTDWYEGAQLLSITVVTKEDVSVADIISLNDDVLYTESYDLNDKENNIQLVFRNGEGIASLDELMQNTPNPWAGNTRISFMLDQQKQATLNIFDVTGKLVYQNKSIFNKGLNEIIITDNDIRGNGIYYYELTTENFKAVKKMIISH